MIYQAFALLLLAIGVASADFNSAGFKAQLLAAHNLARQAAHSGLPNLAWSRKLEGYAQEWASKCDYGHRTEEDLASKNSGENIYAAWGYDLASIGQTATKKWVSEKADYNYGSNSCKPGEKCGHYTAIVWKTTTTVGCGFALCEGGMQFVVCNYSPSGNMVGEKPY